MKANDTRAKGMVFNQKAGEYIQELEADNRRLSEIEQRRIGEAITQADSIAELREQLAALREAADKYSGWGHHEICQAIPDYNIKCVCGLAELEALITPEDTTPGPAQESSQEAPEKT